MPRSLTGGIFGRLVLYKTTKFAQVRSPTLAAGNLLTRIAISCYVVGQIIVGQKHFELLPLKGDGSFDIQAPSVGCNPLEEEDCRFDLKNSSALPYCRGYTGPFDLKNSSALPSCRHVDHMTLARYDAKSTGSFFLPTSIIVYSQRRLEDGTFMSVGDPKTEVFADIEDFYILTKAHVWAPPSAGLQPFVAQHVYTSTWNMANSKCGVNADGGFRGECAHSPSSVTPIPPGDIVKVEDLLRLAGLNFSSSNKRGVNLRMAGQSLVMSIEFSNDGVELLPWRTPPLTYAVRVLSNEDESVCRYFTEAGHVVDHRTVERVCGLEISLDVSGTYGQPTVSQLIVVLTSALTLLFLSDEIVDTFAMNFWKHKIDFENAKFDVSCTFDKTCRGDNEDQEMVMLPKEACAEPLEDFKVKFAALDGDTLTTAAEWLHTLRAESSERRGQA